MTKDEIKKGLKCCETDWCVRCPYFECIGCEVGLKQDALNLITEQEKEIEQLKVEYEKLQTNEEILAKGIRDLYDENCELTKKLAKQTRIARDANAKFTGVEHYLKPFQYKADRLQTKCDDLKKLSDWQREEIKRLKAEVNKGCDDCETIKQGQVDMLKKLRSRIADKESLIQSYIADSCLTIEDMYTEIDELIKEVQKE